MDGDILTDKWLTHIAEIAQNGQSVLVCCNTVKRTQQVYEEMKRRLKEKVEIVLLHGRFNGKDRLIKEKIVRMATGSGSLERKPITLVATQVVEVSLDIDLDIIFTDPAPLEALIQRFGRVNRRRLKEWAPVCVFTKPSDGQGVYDDDLIQAALAVLIKNADHMIDEGCISHWLDEVYQGAISARWNQTYQQAYDDFEEACLRTLRAFNSDQRLEEAFYRAFDSIEVLPAPLEAEYRRLVEDEPLEASQLLVPLRWGQLWKLHQEGKVRASEKSGWPKIIDANYTTDLGLSV